MSNKRIFITLLVFIAVLMPATVARTQGKPADQVQWRTDYPAACKEALGKKRPLLLWFDTISNPYGIMTLKAWSGDKHIIQIIDDNFIAVKIDAQQEPSLAGFLRIESYPATVFATCNGRILQKVTYIEPPEFRELLHRVLAESSAPDWRTNSLPRRTGCYPR